MSESLSVLTKFASKGLSDEADRLMKEEGLNESDARRVAASTMDGAGDNPDGTVSSVQTCTDIGGNFVEGLTTDDNPLARSDDFSSTEQQRLAEAEKGVDDAAKWLADNDPDLNK